MIVFSDIKLKKDKTHPVPKESFTSEEQKQNVHHFQKRTRNARKSKKIKIGGERVSLDFPCHANQVGIRKGGWGRKKNTFVIRAVTIT